MTPSTTCARSKREAAVDEHRAQLLLRRPPVSSVSSDSQLRVAVLLDDEDALVRGEERLDALAEREAADAHVVGDDAALAPARPTASRTAGSQPPSEMMPNVAPVCVRITGAGTRLGGRLVLAQQAVHHLLVLVGDLGVAAELVVARAAREERALGVHAGQRARRDVVVVLVGE